MRIVDKMGGKIDPNGGAYVIFRDYYDGTFSFSQHDTIEEAISEMAQSNVGGATLFKLIAIAATEVPE